MPAATPAQLSYDIVRQISLFRGSSATAAAGRQAKHLRHANVRHFLEGETWDAASSSDLATSPAALSSALLRLLFNRTSQEDLVELSQDAIQGLEVTELDWESWPSD